jgi:sortase (surface protein transpeptidase)
MDSDGRMDVPGSSFTVGWWKLGTIPGELGSAVIDGHFDTPQGKPGVFYDLGKLSADDQIIVLDEYGHDLRFAVRSVSSVSDNNFPLEKVFADSSGRRLNLITCSGTWDRALKNYSDRLVVYSELIP